MTAWLCPYPGCTSGEQNPTDAASCGCEWRRPVVLCPCGLVNRAEARFCRGCREAISRPELQAEKVQPGPVSMLEVPGSFRQPPAIVGNWLYAHTREGQVFELAMRPGAKPRLIGRLLLASMGFNRAAVVDFPPAGLIGPNGWNYVVASPAGIEAISLATGESRRLYKPRSGEPVAAIQDESDSHAMCGVASDGTLTAMVLRSSTDTRTLMSIATGQDRPAEVLLTLSGEKVAGPALCAGRLAVCTERQVGIYDRKGGGAVADFPRGFAPLLEPDGGDLAFAPGSLPLVLDEAAGPSRRVWVAGRRGGKSGLLKIDFNAPEELKFRELPQGSSLSRQQDGSACLCTVDGVEVFGAGTSRRVAASLRGWMPASLAGPLVTWFDYTAYPEKHKVAMGWDDRRFSVAFESRDCNSETCCGAYLSGQSMVVCSLDRKAGSGQAGLKLARWSLAG